MKITEIIETFIKEGYVASSVKASGGKSGVIICLLRKENITVAISCDRCGHKFYVAEEDGIPISFYRNSPEEVERWKGNPYGIRKDEVFQPSASQALAQLSDITHYAQINCLDFIILLSQK